MKTNGTNRFPPNLSPQGFEPLRFGLLPVRISDQRTAAPVVELQDSSHEAHVSHPGFLLALRGVGSLPHPQRRKPSHRLGRLSRRRLGQPHPDEKDLRHGEVRQHERDPRLHVGIVTLLKPELDRAGHAVSYGASRDRGVEERGPHPSDLDEEKPAGGRQRLHRRRH